MSLGNSDVDYLGKENRTSRFTLCRMIQIKGFAKFQLDCCGQLLLAGLNSYSIDWQPPSLTAPRQVQKLSTTLWITESLRLWGCENVGRRIWVDCPPRGMNWSSHLPWLIVLSPERNHLSVFVLSPAKWSGRFTMSHAMAECLSRLLFELLRPRFFFRCGLCAVFRPSAFVASGPVFTAHSLLLCHISYEICSVITMRRRVRNK